MNKLRNFLEQIAKQHEMEKSKRSFRTTELCNYSRNTPKPFEYPNFVAFIQSGHSKKADEMVYSSSDSGTDTKEEEQDDCISTSLDSNSETEFGDDEGNSPEPVSNSEEEGNDMSNTWTSSIKFQERK